MANGVPAFVQKFGAKKVDFPKMVISNQFDFLFAAHLILSLIDKYRSVFQSVL